MNVDGVILAGIYHPAPCGPGFLFQLPTGVAQFSGTDRLRLDRFSQDHPAVVFGAGNGWWQAVIPEPNGEIVTTRYTLRALPDRSYSRLTAQASAMLAAERDERGKTPVLVIDFTDQPCWRPPRPARLLRAA